MKNVLTTLIMLAVVAALGVGGWYFMSPPRDPVPEVDLTPALNANVEIEGMLDPKKQEIIWEAEHFTFQIEHRLGKAFLGGWADHDSEKMAALLLPEFKAGLPTSDQWTVTDKPPLEQRSRTIEESDLKSTPDKQAFVDFLLDPIKGVKIEQKKLRVLKIRRLDEKRWACRFLLAGSGPVESSVIRQYQSESDVIVHVVDKQELADVPSIESWQLRTETIRQSNAPIMHEITSSLGLDQFELMDNWKMGKGEANQHNFQVAVEDFDQDNDFDISVMSFNGKRFLLEFRDGKYIDVTREKGLPPSALLVNGSKDKQEFTYDADGNQVPINSKFATAWIDIDNDGYPDLISGSSVYHNDQGKQFTDITEQTGLKFDYETMGHTIVDFDNDGFLDLYSLYQQPVGVEKEKNAKWIDESQTGNINRLQRNNGDGTFTDVTVTMNASGGFRHTHAAVWLYYNDDLYPDVYMANDFGRNVLLQSSKNGTYFEDVSDQSGADGFATSMGVVSGDVDNDGNSDLYVANMFSKMGRRIIDMVSEDDYTPAIYQQILGSCAGNQLYCRTKDGKYEDNALMAGVNEVGWAWAPTMFDIDSDGWLDLYSTSGFMSFDHETPDG